MDPKNIPSVKLNNGNSIPIIGLGTWQSEADGTLYRAVRAAIKNGYRHIDGAYAYENEEEVGRAINDSINDGTVTREELFIVSKLWLTFYKRDRVPICVKRILSRLNTPYLDLCLIHWPMAFDQVDDTLVPVGPDNKCIYDMTDNIEAWQGLEDCVRAGLIRNIGISNFNSLQIERLLKVATIKPVTNQVECHPYLAQRKLIDFCAERGITITAYSPLGNPGSTVNNKPDKGQLLKDPLVAELAKKYGKNIGQVLIRFQIERGVIVIPKSVHEDRIISNLNVFDFNLTAEEVKQLEALDRNYRSCLFDVFEIPAHPHYPFNDRIAF